MSKEDDVTRDIKLDTRPLPEKVKLLIDSKKSQLKAVLERIERKYGSNWRHSEIVARSLSNDLVEYAQLHEMLRELGSAIGET